MVRDERSGSMGRERTNEGRNKGRDIPKSERQEGKRERKQCGGWKNLKYGKGMKEEEEDERKEKRREGRTMK